MTPTTTTAAARPRSPYVRAGAPTLAALGVLVWWIGMMGVIDLAVPLVPLEDFFDAYLVETGWGLFYTFLLGAPTLVLAFRPSSDVAAQHVLVSAAALAFAALAAPEPGHLVPAAIATALVLAVRASAGGRALPASPSRRLAARDVPGLVVVLAGLVPAGAYASMSLDAFRDPVVTSDVTNGLDHWPAQAALALAVVLVAALAVLAVRGWLLPTLTATTSAVWLGLTSVAFPTHDGSLGTTGGWLAAAWGVALLVAVAVPRLPRRRPAPAGPDGQGEAAAPQEEGQRPVEA